MVMLSRASTHRTTRPSWNSKIVIATNETSRPDAGSPSHSPALVPPMRARTATRSSSAMICSISHVTRSRPRWSAARWSRYCVPRPAGAGPSNSASGANTSSITATFPFWTASSNSLRATRLFVSRASTRSVMVSTLLVRALDSLHERRRHRLELPEHFRLVSALPMVGDLPVADAVHVDHREAQLVSRRLHPEHRSGMTRVEDATHHDLLSLRDCLEDVDAQVAHRVAMILGDALEKLLLRHSGRDPADLAAVVDELVVEQLVDHVDVSAVHHVVDEPQYDLLALLAVAHANPSDSHPHIRRFTPSVPLVSPDGTEATADRPARTPTRCRRRRRSTPRSLSQARRARRDQRPPGTAPRRVLRRRRPRSCRRLPSPAPRGPSARRCAPARRPRGSAGSDPGSRAP